MGPKTYLILEYLSENYARIELNEETINFAARIFNLYKKHDSTKGYKITDGDIINGAITIALNCCIMTIDNNDYPRPFFKEISRHSLIYNSSTVKTDPGYGLHNLSGYGISQILRERARYLA